MSKSRISKQKKSNRNANRLGEFLKEKRMQAGKSQSDISELLGYTSGQFVSNWERGISSPPLSALAKIVSALKIDQKEIIELIINETREELENRLGGDSKRTRRANSA